MAAASVILLLSLGIGLTMPFVLKPILKSLAVIDVPNHRSSHSAPVVRGAGLAPALALSAGLVGFAIIDSGPNRMIYLTFLITAILSAALGWFEDYKGVPVLARLGAQFGIGLLFSILIGVQTNGIHWWLPIAVFFIAGYINAANFMDGINGISVFHALAVGISFGVIGFVYNLPWITLVGVLLAVSFIGFLPLNALGKMFLGDVGSYLLGGIVSALAVGAFSAGVPLLVAIAPLSIYLADTGYTLLKRLLRGAKVFEAHREHVFQQITPAFLPHIQGAFLNGLLAVVAGLVALMLYQWNQTVLGYITVFVLALGYLFLPELVRRFDAK